MVLLNNIKTNSKKNKKQQNNKQTKNSKNNNKNIKQPALKVDMVPLPNSRVLQRLSKAHFNHRRIWEDLNDDDNGDDDHWPWWLVMDRDDEWE